jgi:hypothetical protein
MKEQMRRVNKRVIVNENRKEKRDEKVENEIENKKKFSPKREIKTLSAVKVKRKRKVCASIARE